MTKLLLSALACFAFVATTSFVFADANEPNPVPGNGQQQMPQAEGDPQQPKSEQQ
jgi:hypothetical protein